MSTSFTHDQISATRAAEAIVHASSTFRVFRDRPWLIAIDGGSGSGKTTVAKFAAELLGAVLVPGDDFFAADITTDEWLRRSPRLRASDCIDWRKLRREALEPLLCRTAARWRCFDWAHSMNADGTYNWLDSFEERSPADLILLEGTYSCRPELSDLIDFSVLVDVPVNVRHNRLTHRATPDWLEMWHKRWDDAERYYFESVRPPHRFDFVVANG